MQILGVSTDDAEANAEFAASNEFTFPLLCDTDRKICLAYGAVESETDTAAKRITYVIGPDQKIVQAYAKVDAGAHAEQLLGMI